MTGRPIPREAPDRSPATGETEKLLTELRTAAAEYGLVLVARCRHCGHPLTRDESIRDRSGPVCSRRNTKAPAGAQAAKHSTDEGRVPNFRSTKKENEQ